MDPADNLNTEPDKQETAQETESQELEKSDCTEPSEKSEQSRATSGKERLFILAGRTVVAIIVVASCFFSFATVRALSSPWFLWIDGGREVQCDGAASVISTSDELKFRLSAHGCDTYKVRFYRRTKSLVQGKLIDPVRFELTTVPSVISKLISVKGQTPLSDITGNLSWFEFLEGQTEVTCPKLPPGDYIYTVEAFQSGRSTGQLMKGLHISDVGLLIREIAGKSVVKVFDLRTLKPLSATKIAIFKVSPEESRPGHEWTQPEHPLVRLVDVRTGTDGCVVVDLKDKLAAISGTDTGVNYSLAYFAEAGQSRAWAGNSSQDMNYDWANQYGGMLAPGTVGPQDQGIIDVISDRTVYRLGQDVYFKGFVRHIEENGLVNGAAGKPVQLSITDPRGQQLQVSNVRMGPYGDFDGHFKIPADGQTGSYNVSVSASDSGPYSSSSQKEIQVLQYRKPEYEVSILPAKVATISGEKLKVKIKARYFFGAPVAGATVSYRINSAPNYEIRNQLKDVPSYYSFFKTPSYRSGYYYYGDAFNKDGSAVTDKNGEAEVVVDTPAYAEATGPFDARGMERDYNYSVEVTDLSRKTAEGIGSALVTAGDYVVILESSRSVLKPGEKVSAKIKAIDYNNKSVKNAPVKVSLEQWAYEDKTYVKKKVVMEKTVITDDHGNGVVDLAFPADTIGGRYYLFASATDGGGHKITDSTYLWLTAPGMMDDMEETPAVSIDLDKPVYKPGETMRAVVKSPIKKFGRASALATISGVSLHDYKNLELDSQTSLLEIPLKQSYAPQCQLSLTAVNQKHEMQFVDMTVPIYPEPFMLSLDIKPGKLEYGPAETASVDFVVRKSDGSPAADTELVVSVTDESLFSVKPDDHDIRQTFYGSRYFSAPATNTSFLPLPAIVQPIVSPWFRIDWLFPDKLRSEVDYMRSASCDAEKSIPQMCMSPSPGSPAPMLQGATNGTIGPQGGDATVIQGVNTASSPSPSPSPVPSGGGSGGAPAKPSFAAVAIIRSNFRDSAYWSGTIVTDANGHAKAKFKLPDNLTTWRVTASAASKQSSFGAGKTTLTVTKQILARMSLPRFFTVDDEGFVTGIVHNYSKKNQLIRMELSASNQFAIGKDVKQEVSVEPQGVAKFSWPVVVKGEGKGKLELKTLGQSDSDAMVQTLPLRPFSFPAFATKNGILKEDALVTTLPLKLTPDARPGSGTFRLSVAPSAIGPVLGNFDNLIDYPYGCTEQTMSRMMPSVVAMQLHKKLGLPLNPGTLDLFKDVHRRCFIKLVEHQNNDGGWGWWGGDASNPYLTAYVMEGLYLLRQAGYTVDQSMIDSGNHRLVEMVSGGGIAWERESATDQAYVAYVASLWGNKLLARHAVKQLENSLKLGPEGLSYLTMAFKRSGEERAAKAMYDQLISLANKNWEYTTWEHTPSLIARLGERNKALDYTYRFTGVESTALAMQAVLAMEPENEKLLTSIRRWILFQRDENGWNNTKTTARVFLTLLDDELAARAGKPTNFTASASVNEKTLATFVFDKTNQYSTEKMLTVPLKGDETEMAIKKFGTGRLYFSSLLTYQRRITPGKTVVPRSSPPDLAIERKFYRLESFTDPKTNITSVRALEIPKEGVRAGETILMKLVIDSPATLPYVMLDAALPSGAEVQSEQTSIQTPTADGTSSDACQFNYWWTHQDVLDDRVVFFATRIPAGKSNFQALLRMEMPGKFNVNPVSFEGMYSKAIRGYSNADQIVVHE